MDQEYFKMMDNDYCKMRIEPGRTVFGMQLDYLVFKGTDIFPESGWFVACSSEWEQPQLCQVVPPEFVHPRDGKPRYLSKEGLLPADAVPIGRLVSGEILFDRDLKGE